jgi:hypothetical protein
MSKADLAEVQKKSYSKGMDAYKKGDREGVVQAITDLQGEEAKLRDRWALVDKIHRDVVGNAEVTLSKGGGLFGGGASKYAEQTGKITSVKADMKSAHNDVYARRVMLQRKLADMNSVVRPDTFVPKKVTRFEEEAPRTKIGSKVEKAAEMLQQPVKVTESVFK